MAENNLEHMVYRRKDIREIRNLMSRYSYLQWAALYDKIVELFSYNNSDAKAEISNWGIYEGREGIKRLYTGL